MALRGRKRSQLICSVLLGLFLAPVWGSVASTKDSSVLDEDSRRKAALDDYGVFSRHYVLGTFECRNMRQLEAFVEKLV
ncbi:MAG: hypothetical protein RL119_1402 [Actinomycetota bacterium]